MVAAVIRAACTISPRYRVGQRLAAATMALVMVRDFQRLARYRLCDQTGITASSVAQETAAAGQQARSEEHTSELQPLMRISYAVFCLKKKTTTKQERLTVD